MPTEIKQVSSYRLHNVVRDLIRLGAQVSDSSEAEFLENCVLKYAHQVASERIDVLTRARALRDELERGLAEKLTATSSKKPEGPASVSSRSVTQRGKRAR